MEEKIYKTMGSTGAANLAIGICILVGGIVSGILLIVNGARLLKHKGKIMFFRVCLLSVNQDSPRSRFNQAA